MRNQQEHTDASPIEGSSHCEIFRSSPPLKMYLPFTENATQYAPLETLSTLDGIGNGQRRTLLSQDAEVMMALDSLTEMALIWSV